MFDSGSGGLSVLRQLREVFPESDVVYFADIKNAPYGVKSQSELARLTYNALSLLREKEATDIVSACNSVSASLTVSLFDTLFIEQKIIEMVGPTVAKLRDENRRIAVCATEATINSGMYENGLHMVGKENVINIPIPELAGQIEFGASKKDIATSINDALLPYTDQFDVCVLACTHFPLVRDVFEQALGESVEIFDPATAVAERAKKIFDDVERGSGRVTFLLSEDSKHFRGYVEELFQNMTYSIEIV